MDCGTPPKKLNAERGRRRRLPSSRRDSRSRSRRPSAIAGLRVDELDVHTHPIAAALNASFQHIAHVQFAADLPHIEGLALVGEGGVARDHKGTRNAREIGGQALGHAIDEVVLLGITAQVRERQVLPIPPPPDMAGAFFFRCSALVASAGITRPPQSVTKIAPVMKMSRQSAV
jgi:hypothetical protein